MMQGGENMRARKILAMLVVALLLMTVPGPAASKRKKPEKQSGDTVQRKYWLPYPGGVSHRINQGFHGKWTHNDGNQNEYAIDFGSVVGDVVCAIGAGTVIRVADADQTDDKNVIMIQHEDGEVSVYAHNQLGSVKVTEGDDVVAGTEICCMGKLLHLHLAVWKAYRGIPMGFKDVDDPNGEPIEFHVYKSKNYIDKRKAGIVDPEMLRKMSLDRLMKSARKYMDKKKYKRARKYLDRAKQHPSADDKMKKEITDALAKIESEAVKTLDKAKKLLAANKPRDAKKVLFKMMRYFKGTKVFEEARQLLRSIKSVSLEKRKIIQSPEKMLEMVEELIKAEKFNTAFSLLNSLGKMKGKVGEKAREIRKKLMDSKEIQKKRESKKSGEEIRLIFERVQQLRKAYEYEEAIDQLKRVIRLYPDTEDAKKAKKLIKVIEDEM
jgi:tetratricopeptide (TPR) repeat protein